MNDALQALEVKVENGGATPQGKVFAKEWNVLVEAVKALDLKEINEAALHKFLQDNGYITEDDIPTTDLSNVVTLATGQTIQGRKNFVGGVEVNGGELVYDAEKKVWQLAGDLFVTGAITMFGNISGFTPSTIMDAVLVDGTTIVKNAQGQLTVIGGGGGNTGGLSVADLENYLSTNRYTTEDAVSSLITEKLTGYATTDWVAQQGYAKQSSLVAVDNRLAAVEVFFATEDNDTLVNKWAEIVAFLNATEGDTLDNILSTKANKATTLAGYGITDAYTKAEINNTVSSLNSSIATKWTQDNSKIANWDSAYGWGNHASAGYAAKTYVDTELTKYVKLTVAQSIEAQHNFVNGLKIGGLPITKSGSANNTIYLDANLAVSGAITMFGSSSTTFPTIWANIPFDSTMQWDGSKWSVIGDGTGSVDDATVRVIVNEVLVEKGYATEKWVTDKDYATVSVVSSAISSALNPYALKTDIPTYTLRASSTIGKFYLQRNGVDSANVTIKLPTSLPASDVYAWAKAEFPTYLTSYGIIVADEWAEPHGLSLGGFISDDSGFGYPYGTILNITFNMWHHRLAFRTDGLIDHWMGINTNELHKIGQLAHTSDIPVNISQLTNDANYATLTDNVASATKLQTPRTIWGHSFDGTGNINGGLEIINENNLLKLNSENATWASTTILRYDYTSEEGDSLKISVPGYAFNNAYLHLTVHKGAIFSSNVTIAGDLAVSGGEGLKLEAGNEINSYYSTNNLHLNYRVRGNVSLVAGGGNVAIGGTTADAKLHVHGTALFTDDVTITTGALQCYTLTGEKDKPIYHSIELGYPNRDYIDFNEYGGDFRFNQTSNGIKAELVRILPDITYINTPLFTGDITTPSITPTSGTLTVNGNLLTTGAITMFSQLSMKNVIDYDGLSLAQLAQIKPARFTWKDSRDTLIHAGGIADDVMQVLPEVVHRTADDKLTMDYGSAGFFIATSLIKPVIDHEHRIADLERENQQLKQQLEQLSA